MKSNSLTPRTNPLNDTVVAIGRRFRRLLVGGVLLAATLASATEVRLNRIIYTNESLVTATVTVDAGTLVTNKYLYLASGTSGDAEVIPLDPIPTDPNVYVTRYGIPVFLNDGTSPVTQLDGKLMVKTNEFFFAYFFPQAYVTNQPKGTQAFADFGVIETPGLINPATIVMPQIAMTSDETNPPAGGKKVGTLVPLHGVPGQVALDELVIYPLTPAQLVQFVLDTQGTILIDHTTNQPVGEAYALVRVNTDLADLAHLPQMRAVLGLTNTLLASNLQLTKLLALTLQLQLEGYAVFANPRLKYMGAPSTRDGTDANPLDYMSPDSALSTDIFATNLFGVRKAWAYLALWERDTNDIPVAVLDMGFAPNWDFRGYNPSVPDLGLFQRDLEGHSASAVGPPTVGASFFGPRMWHGNGVVTTMGGVLNNGWGGAGTGGQIARPRLYKMGLLSYALEMGAGIDLAVDEGATIINISAGYPCNIDTEFGSLPCICDPLGRTAFCTALTAAMGTATAILCAVPFVGWIACPAAIAGDVAVSGACYSTLILGDIRAPMERAVAHATARGVTVVSVSGNAADVGDLCIVIACGKQDIRDWQVVPGIIPGVICVGAADATWPYANNQYYGDRVDVWAPVGGVFWHPPTVDAVTGPELQVREDGFSGTSAAAPYVAGIIAMMEAVNPTLDPRTPGLTPDQLSAIPGRIGTMLRNSATPAAALPADPGNPDLARRRNLVNAYAAVRAAAQGVLPDTDALGYDSSLGFNEVAPNPTHDTETQALLVDSGTIPPSGTEFTDTILTLPSGGDPVGPTFTDQDWYAYRIPSAPAGLWDGGRVQLRQPRNGTAGQVLINNLLGTIVASTPTEVVREYSIQRLYDGATNTLFVASSMGSDNAYKIRFFSSHWVAAGLPPDRFDQLNGNPPYSDNNSIEHSAPLGGNFVPWQVDAGGGVGPGMLSATGMVINLPGLNFHNRDDVDWFQLSLPAGQEPASCVGCPPRLTIQTAPNVLIDVFGSDRRMIVHSVPTRATLGCTQYRGRTPLYIELHPARPGMAVEYNLQISYLYPSFLECNWSELFAPMIAFPFAFPFPGPDPLWDPPYWDTFILPTDFNTDTLGRITDAQNYAFGWGATGPFDLLATAPGGESMVLKLLNTSGTPVAQVSTSDMQFNGFCANRSGAAPVQLHLSVSQLPAGVYFVSVSYLHFGTPLGLYLSRAATLPGMVSYEDLVNTSFVPGDFNGDALFDQSDVNQLQALLKTNGIPTADQLRAADADGDGKLTSIDAQKLQYALDNQTDLRTNWPGYTPPMLLTQSFDHQDSDGDGLLDWWEISHGLNPHDPNDAQLDSSGYGRSNLAEYLCGSEPKDPNSQLKLRVCSNQGKSQLVFNPPIGRTFTIEYTDDLTSGRWFRLMDVEQEFYPRTISADLGAGSTLGASVRFYRVVTPARP